MSFFQHPLALDCVCVSSRTVTIRLSRLPSLARNKGNSKGSATVLDGKDKVRVFEKMVGEDDELSHEGGKSEFLALPRSRRRR